MSAPDEPIVELIAENVVETIAAVSVANGFWYDLTPERPKRRDTGNTIADRVVLVMQGDPYESDEAPIGTEQYEQPFQLMAFVNVPEDEVDEVPIDKKINRIRSDIEKALMLDADRGGYAIDTEIDLPIRFEDEAGAFQGVIIGVIVKYRVDQDDPYVQR